MNRQMRRMLNKNTKELSNTLEKLGVELNADLFKNIDVKSKNKNSLLATAQELKEKTAKLEKMLLKKEFKEQEKSDIKVNIK